MINDTSNLKEHFILNPNITFLNHGSYGACPISVFEENQKWQRKMERDPVKFMHKLYRVPLHLSLPLLILFENTNWTSAI